MVAIDLWIGKTMFVPLIIKLCQVTGQGQFAISLLFWFIAALEDYRSDTHFASIIFGVLSIVMMLTRLTPRRHACREHALVPYRCADVLRL